MPPKKGLDTSRTAPGDEGTGTPAKDIPVKEGVNIEVHKLVLHSACDLTSAVLKSWVLVHDGNCA